MSVAPIAAGYAPTPERLVAMEARSYKAPNNADPVPAELALALKKKQEFEKHMTLSVRDQANERILKQIAAGRLPFTQDVLVAKFQQQ